MFVVDVSGVGKAVASMLHERGFFFQPVTWVAGDSVKEHHSDGWRVGKQYLMAQLGAALSSNRLQILDGLRDGPEIERRLADYQVEFTQAGNMTMNAAPGAHDDYVAALAMANFGLSQLSTMAATIEKAAKGDSLDEATSLIVQLPVACDRARAELKSYLGAGYY